MVQTWHQHKSVKQHWNPGSTNLINVAKHLYLCKLSITYINNYLHTLEVHPYIHSRIWTGVYLNQIFPYLWTSQLWIYNCTKSVDGNYEVVWTKCLKNKSLLNETVYVFDWYRNSIFYLKNSRSPYIQNCNLSNDEVYYSYIFSQFIS